MSRWFIEVSGRQIEGPFSTEIIQSRLDSGQLQTTDLIWGRVLEEWRPLSWWSRSLNDLAKQEQEIANPQVWHYALGGGSFGPLGWQDLVQNLRSTATSSLEQLFQVMIWTKGMREWASVLEFHDLLDTIGVNRRESARATISGRAMIKTQGHTYISPLRTVSEGGFGCDPVSGVLPGEIVTVELQSDAFKTPVHAKAQIRYTSDKMAGFKFTQINTESRGLVVQLVRKSSGVQFYINRAAS